MEDNIKEDATALMAEQARSYQLEMFEHAKRENTIVCLGTGTGKTFISVLLAKHYEHQVAGPWLNENNERIGKRIVFLAPTVPLVEQQSVVLRQHMSVKVACFVGTDGTDNWNEENWNKELQLHGVLVMTPEVCRLAIDHGFLPISNINLLILDECHSAAGEGPYVQILRSYSSVREGDRPRILGLTASVVNARVQGLQVSRKIKELESRLCSVARTASQKVLDFGTKPTEIIVAYEEHDNKKVLPIDREKMSLLDGCADRKEFGRMMDALSNTYVTCGAFCAKELLTFREIELQKALHHPECSDGFKEFAHVKKELYETIRGFLGQRPSALDLPPKMKKLLEILKQFRDTNLSAVVFVKERMTAYVLYTWLDTISKLRDGEFSFINCSFIVGQGQSSGGEDQGSLKRNSKTQQKVMRDFRNGVYNLIFATSVIEEGMDVPACNLIVRFDPPPDVRSYVQSKGRARAKPSLYVLLASERELQNLSAELDNFQETEQLVMLSCETKRSAPTAYESARILQDDPDLPPYVNGVAKITAAGAVSIVYGYCQRFMRMKYPNVFPDFDVKETPEGFVCTLTMPIVCPVREQVSNADRPFPNKDKARAYVALEMCKRLHRCGELADNLWPRTMHLNLYKLPMRREDIMPYNDLKKEMIVKLTRSGEKKRYLVPRKQANMLKLREENVDFGANEEFRLYVIKTEVVAWASKEQNWRGDALFDPSKSPKWLGILVKAESPEMKRVPQFSIFTRSGEERVSFIDAGSIDLDVHKKALCSRFNRYVFDVVLRLGDNMMDKVTSNFFTPCIVPIIEHYMDMHRFQLDIAVLQQVGPPKLPNITNFVFREEDYDDAVVELLYHLNENQEDFSQYVHTKIPKQFYPRAYVKKTITCGEDGRPLTPRSTGYYGFDPSLSFADYALQRERRAGAEDLLEAYQPVLTVEHAHNRLQMLRPRHANQQEKRQNYKDDDGSKYLIPQFAALHSIKASLWRKITSLPSILHRLNRLLVAEDIRLEISAACRLRPMNYSTERWPPMSLTITEKQEVKQMSSREFDELCRGKERTFDRSKLGFPALPQPDLKKCVGPSPCDIMKALTTKGCNELFDLERLELLGDSFLKVIATFAVLDRNQKKGISELNVLRQNEINNKHLLYRAHDKKLTSALESQQFRPLYNFLPFGFKECPFEKLLLQRLPMMFLVNYFGMGRDSKPLLKDLRFCKDIQALLECAAQMSPEELTEMISDKSLTSEDLPKRNRIPVRLVHDFKAKVGGDVVEALAGVYLETCGPIGALRFFKWIGKDFGDTKTNNFLDAFSLDFSAAQSVSVEQMKQYIHLIEKIEGQIGYTFNSKGLALQAITHHSCREHLLTDDNNKLAFVGEAVVDYLLTLYIYGVGPNLNPGQLTDLRSALINNQVTAHAVVRANLHTCLLYTNTNLFRAIRKYVANIDDIGLRLNTVFDDSETEEIEEAEIPSPVARILQSILGAVFIDSDKNLETVWTTLVNIMGYEISLFTRNVPISPVKELFDMFPGSFFTKPSLITEGPDAGRFEVTLYVFRDDKEREEDKVETYIQVADTKKIAKTTLAKKYLRKLENERRKQDIEARKKAQIVDEETSLLSKELLESELRKSKFYRKR